MTDVPAGVGRPRDESDSVDDDALADAILATYTSSVPVIRPEPPVGSGTEVPGTAADQRLLAETASWTSADPSVLRSGPGSPAEPADRGWVWNLDGGADPHHGLGRDGAGDTDADADAGPSTVWDLDDPGSLGGSGSLGDRAPLGDPGSLGGPGPFADGDDPWRAGPPGGFESFDLPAPEDATPIDLLADSSPKPWDELPAPSPASKEDDGKTWASSEEPITPFDPQPFPVERTGPWTRLVEPDGSEPATVPDAADAAVWRPPVDWAPPATGPADFLTAPAPAMPWPAPQPGSVQSLAAEDFEKPDGAEAPRVQDADPDPAGPDPAEAHLAEPSAAAPLIGEEPDSWGDLPPAPPVGGNGGTATPWFDLASAPPPAGAPAVADGRVESPEQPAPVEPAPVEHGELSSTFETDSGPELGRGTGDAAYRDDDDGSVDASDRAPLVIAGLPPGTVQTSTLPPAQAAASVVEAPPVVTTASARLPRVLEVETAGAEPTRLDQRAGRATRLFWLWFAPNAAPLSLGGGAVLFGMGMSLRQAIIAVIGGVLLSFLPLGLGSLAGKWSGQPTLVVSRASFGLVGNLLPGAVAVLSRAVWGGVLLWVVGDAVRAGAERMGSHSTGVLWPLLGVLVAAAITGVVAVVGYGLLSRVQVALTVASAAVAVGVIAATARRVNIAAALEAGDGPWLTVASGVVLVFTVVGLAWVHGSADVARYQSATGTGSSTMLAASLGAGLPALTLIGWGALLAASSPSLARGLEASPLEALALVLPAWLPLPLLAGAILASLAGAIIATYSGGFAVLGALVPGDGARRMPRPVATAIAVLLAAVVGALLVLTGADARDLIREVLTTIAVPVAAWAGIFLAEVMIRNRRFHTPSLLRRGGIYPDIRVMNLVSFVLISALAFGFTTARIGWLSWQGWALWLLGIPRADPLAGSDIGVFLALALGLLVPLLSAIPAIRRQEALRA